MAETYRLANGTPTPGLNKATANEHVPGACEGLTALEAKIADGVFPLAPNDFLLSTDTQSIDVPIDENWKFAFARSSGYINGAFVNISGIDRVISWSRTQTYDGSSTEIRNVVQNVSVGTSFLMDNNFGYGNVGTVDQIAVYDWTEKVYYIFRLFAYTDSGGVNHMAVRLEHRG